MEKVTLDKKENVIVYILSNIGKKLGATELVKITYLTDVYNFRLFGKKMTHINYIRYNYGPYSKDIKEALLDLDLKEIIDITIGLNSTHTSQKISHTMKQEIDPDLNNVEKEIIKMVLDQVKDKSPKEIKKLAYMTEPMEAVISDEKKLDKKLLETPLNFDLIKRDEFMMSWLKNITTYHEEDLEYDQYLFEDKKKLAGLLAS